MSWYCLVPAQYQEEERKEQVFFHRFLQYSLRIHRKLYWMNCRWEHILPRLLGQSCIYAIHHAPIPEWQNAAPAVLQNLSIAYV